MATLFDLGINHSDDHFDNRSLAPIERRSLPDSAQPRNQLSISALNREIARQQSERDRSYVQRQVQDEANRFLMESRREGFSWQSPDAVNAIWRLRNLASTRRTGRITRDVSGTSQAPVVRTLHTYERSNHSSWSSQSTWRTRPVSAAQRDADQLVQAMAALSPEASGQIYAISAGCVATRMWAVDHAANHQRSEFGQSAGSSGAGTGLPTFGWS